MPQKAVVMNPKGIRAVLNHPKVQALVNSRADKICAAAGEGFHVKHRPKRVQRYGAQVRTSDKTGRRRAAEENALLKATGAGS